ncbi:hypothetical protein J6590_055256 [Homalodisca vitripennis]|nr:hypothetical protein J6590_055256 [Homalodisca vitripennis]
MQGSCRKERKDRRLSLKVNRLAVAWPPQTCVVPISRIISEPHYTTLLTEAGEGTGRSGGGEESTVRLVRAVLPNRSLSLSLLNDDPKDCVDTAMRQRRHQMLTQREAQILAADPFTALPDLLCLWVTQCSTRSVQCRFFLMWK